MIIKYSSISCQRNYIKHSGKEPKSYVTTAIHEQDCDIVDDVLNKCSCNAEVVKGIPKVIIEGWKIKQKNCDHDEKYRTYQATELDFGINEGYYCDNCDKDLDIPEED